MRKLNIIELFSGCGGLLDGFEKSGKYDTLASVEWKEKQCSVLRRRLKDKYNYEDAEKRVLRFDIQRTDDLLNGWENDEEYGSNEGLLKRVTKPIDLIIGGPPCQAYSIAGRVQDQNSMNYDYRNYLFESYLKVVSVFRPKIFVFENVEGLLSAKPNGVDIIQKIKDEFNLIGYEIIDDIKKYALLDLSKFGIPQKRKRIILIGMDKNIFNEDTQAKLKYFYSVILAQYQCKSLKTVKDAIGDLPKFFPLDNEKKFGNKRFSHTPINSKIPDHYPRFHNKRDIEIFRRLALDIEENTNKYDTTEKLKKLYTEMTGNKSNIHKYNVLRWDSISNTIPAHLKKDGLRHIHPDYNQARSITVREAARLQTFDDDFIFSGNMGADFEMIGNAVPPLFSYKLANALYDFIKKHEI